MCLNNNNFKKVQTLCRICRAIGTNRPINHPWRLHLSLRQQVISRFCDSGDLMILYI